MHDVCLYDTIMVCMAMIFYGNSLSFGLTVVDFASGTFDDRGKAKA